MAAAAIRQQSDPSTRNLLDTVLENELDHLQQRVLETAKGEFFFYLSGSAREFLLLKVTEQRYFARTVSNWRLSATLLSLLPTSSLQIEYRSGT